MSYDPNGQPIQKRNGEPIQTTNPDEGMRLADERNKPFGIGPQPGGMFKRTVTVAPYPKCPHCGQIIPQRQG